MCAGIVQIKKYDMTDIYSEWSLKKRDDCLKRDRVSTCLSLTVKFIHKGKI